ncbi:hypothetical protein MJO28_004276 [Puccinia striiformis f. sp. tritici]|uniref:Uncharacterized protein n=1 Tax=Puccinia striiformis f. sp. tritici TaxID=168172 RepID=A0ACC0EPC5_9BASI|nr:hypothetical protein Pst134EA_007129 [Puccinia striiformis f. sp. tritici]KAH9469853.1 hypothetical protein Pst134EA_007129 [Puccinia striiformis f. sp. tritici]KAI7957181.1 hypothetical protein MJO28_004276 [Puccinia striiformis f. sp. tritici]
MPKASRTKLIHSSQTALSKRQFSLPDQHSQRLQISKVDPTTSANEILHELNDPKAYILPSSASNPRTLTRQNPNRVLRARDGVQPYSKSHAKRLKKKVKEQAVIGDLGPVKEALEEVLATATSGDDSHHNVISNTTQNQQSTIIVSKNHTSKNSISHKQKAKLLQEESTRLPSILNHPEFKKNPFAAIRTHLQNTSSESTTSTKKKTPIVK